MRNSKFDSRRSFLKKAGMGLLALPFISLMGCTTKTQRPNFILIIGDDISWNDLGCYGHPTIRTPNVDRMATEGIRFTNVFLTVSSCSPSRCSIITGRYPHNTGAAELHTPLPEDQIPFPLLLKQAGYYTAAAGKWHMGQSAKRAFDTVIEDRKLNGLGGEDQWVPVLKERPKDKPFFMWFASYDAHRKWEADDFGVPHNPKDAIVPPYLADTDETRKDLASYYNEIARLDFFVGEVEKELARQGVLENTMIIFMADNGRPFPRCKTRVYDSGMKTPFVIKWPAGIKKKGSVCKSLISAIDIAPTILELAGIQPVSSIQGRSFTKLLREPSAKFRNYVFAEHNWHDFEAHERMVRSEKYLYVINNRPQFPNCGPVDSIKSPSHKALKKWRDKGKLTEVQKDIFLAPRPREELFDCTKDPIQTRNLVNNPEYRDVLEEMRKVMLRWQEETGDSVPKNLTHDWYDRESGDALPEKGIRGEMPGAVRNATKINNPGPF